MQVDEVVGASQRAQNKARFELDLETVQALGNPQYLSMLAYQKILDDPAFVNYLKYLLCESGAAPDLLLD